MNQPSPVERDRAQRRVRLITMATAATAGVLTVAGAAVTAGTFSGRTVSSTTSAPDPNATQDPNAVPTVDPGTGLVPPTSPPTDGSGSGGYVQPVVTGGS